jgi:NADH-quinone oxidoreductase subunit H
MQVLGALVAVFFLGGWRGPLLPGPVWLLIKVIAVALAMIWIRATLPRLRYDQLMEIGWKVLIPVSLVNIVVTGALMMLL